MLKVILNSCSFSLQILENESNDKSISPFSVHDKFIKLGMYAPHVIPQEITKFHIQLMHILAAIAILSPAIIEFY
jgi:hypothetical protein